MKNNLPYYLAFSHCLGIGPMKFKILNDHFNSLQSAYESSPEELNPLLGAKLTHDFIEFRKKI